MPSTGWTVLTWCGVLVFGFLVMRGLNHQVVPLYLVGRQPAVPLRIDDWERAGVALSLAVPLGLAKRWPVWVFWSLLAETLVLTLLGQRPWPTLLTADVLMFGIALTRPRGVAAGVGCAAIVGWSLAWLGWMYGLTVPDPHGAGLGSIVRPAPFTLAMAVVWNLTTVVAWMLGNAIRQRGTYAASLRESATARAVMAERLRIARELHDMVAHSIGIVAIQAGAASRVIDSQPAGARDALRAIETTSRETLAGLRHMLVALRHAQPDGEGAAASPADQQRGLADVESLARTAAHVGLDIDIQWLGQRRSLAPEIDLAAFRIVQESVTNVMRHANAAHCRISLDYRDEDLAIEVADDGHGRPHGRTADGMGYGIAGMRERVALLRGDFSAGPRPAGGFRVTARLPL